MRAATIHSIGMAIVLALGGCGAETTLYVESDVPFRGTIIGAGVDRFDHQERDLKWTLGSGTHCWEFQPQAPDGTLRVYLVVDKSISGPDITYDKTTSDPAHVLTGCHSS